MIQMRSMDHTASASLRCDATTSAAIAQTDQKHSSTIVSTSSQAEHKDSA